MARFGKSGDKTPKERGGAPLRMMTGESAISIIGPGMSVEGDIVTDGTVRIEGKIRGTVRAAKAVVLGQGGEVVGDVYTQDAVIGGRVSGTLVAESRLELQGTCTVDGEIRARAEHLQLQEGARFNGQIQMIDGESGAAAPPLLAPGEAPPAA
jgi:cytoskeletal protein CcmA (bactofilin family)